MPQLRTYLYDLRTISISTPYYLRIKELFVYGEVRIWYGAVIRR